jgi:cytidylate kinase
MPLVRSWLLEKQRELAKLGLIVMEGRDIGTVIFPDSKYKFFLTASPEVRARRRLAQDGETFDNATVESVAREIAERDHKDMNRETAPLKQADDAVFVDCSDMNIEETLLFLLSKVKEKQK